MTASPLTNRWRTGVGFVTTGFDANGNPSAAATVGAYIDTVNNVAYQVILNVTAINTTDGNQGASYRLVGPLSE
jgi:hypothetical protein